MKIGIVVPYSWSFWGGVFEHADGQARALRALGIESWTLIGYDPPGSFARLLHPHGGRGEPAPPGVIPLGRSVIVPGNGALSNLVLGPATVPRLRRTLAGECFDLLHVHEPLAPVLGPAALALFDGPVVATFHAAGASAWRPLAGRLWRSLLERIDLRLAVSDQARSTAESYAPAVYEVLPNGIDLPTRVEVDGRRNHVVFVGRHEPRKGLAVLLRAWPIVRRRTGARLRLIGADPVEVRLLLARLRVAPDGIDLLGLLDNGALSSELASAKLLAAPSIGNESFGMVLTRAFASATPVVASDIDGYRGVVTPEVGELVPRGDTEKLADAITTMLVDEPLRACRGIAAYSLAAERYAWPRLADRLADLYTQLLEA